MLVYPMSRLRPSTMCPHPTPPEWSSPSVSLPPFGYLRCFKSDIDAVKCNFGLLNEQIKTSYCVFSHLSVCSPLFCYLRYFKSDLDAVKSNVGLLNELIKNSYWVPSPPSAFIPPLCSHLVNPCTILYYNVQPCKTIYSLVQQCTTIYNLG